MDRGGRDRMQSVKKHSVFRDVKTLCERTVENVGGRSYGAQGRDRTTDTVIFSHVLYQLSYLGGGRRATKRGGL